MPYGLIGGLPVDPRMRRSAQQAQAGGITQPYYGLAHPALGYSGYGTGEYAHTAMPFGPSGAPTDFHMGLAGPPSGSLSQRMMANNPGYSNLVARNGGLAGYQPQQNYAATG